MTVGSSTLQGGWGTGGTGLPSASSSSVISLSLWYKLSFSSSRRALAPSSGWSDSLQACGVNHLKGSVHPNFHICIYLWNNINIARSWPDVHIRRWSGQKRLPSQTSWNSSKQFFNICKSETSGYFQGDPWDDSSHACVTKAGYFWGEVGTSPAISSQTWSFPNPNQVGSQISLTSITAFIAYIEPKEQHICSIKECKVST